MPKYVVYVQGIESNWFDAEDRMEALEKVAEWSGIVINEVEQ